MMKSGNQSYHVYDLIARKPEWECRPFRAFSCPKGQRKPAAGSGKVGLNRRKVPERAEKLEAGCTSQQKVDTTLYFYTSFNEHNTPYTVLESDNSESMPDVLH